MCIIFSYVSKRLSTAEFKLIILSNRDEYFNRPSRPAEFITQNNIYGTDMTPGKEGGTWLGLSNKGKIGALLNLNSTEFGIDVTNKAGRGFLVKNFLNSLLSSEQYVDSIQVESKNLNFFNLVLYEKKGDFWNACIYDNRSFNLNKTNKEFISISNHLYENPFAKTQVGENHFKKIVNDFNDIRKKKELINHLLELAKNNNNEIKATKEKTINEVKNEQIFVETPDYGTRTHTIVLVDNDDNITYYERNLKNPINPNKKEWEDKIFELKRNEKN